MLGQDFLASHANHKFWSQPSTCSAKLSEHIEILEEGGFRPKNFENMILI